MILIPDSSKDVFVCTYDADYETNTYKSKIINKKGEQLFTNYDKVEVIYNNDKSNNIWYEKNIFKVQKDGKYGLINLDGKEILACNYDDITSLKGIASVAITIKDGKEGLVDNVGNITAIAPGFCSIYAIASDGSGKFDKCLIHVIGTGDVKGDINGDGGVTPQDASMILQYVAKKITW